MTSTSGGTGLGYASTSSRRYAASPAKKRIATSAAIMTRFRSARSTTLRIISILSVGGSSAPVERAPPWWRRRGRRIEEPWMTTRSADSRLIPNQENGAACRDPLAGLQPRQHRNLVAREALVGHHRAAAEGHAAVVRARLLDEDVDLVAEAQESIPRHGHRAPRGGGDGHHLVHLRPQEALLVLQYAADLRGAQHGIEGVGDPVHAAAEVPARMGRDAQLHFRAHPHEGEIGFVDVAQEPQVVDAAY